MLQVSHLAKDFRGKTIKDICSCGGGIAVVTEDGLVFIMFANMAVTAECMTVAPKEMLEGIEAAVEQRLLMKDNLEAKNIIDMRSEILGQGDNLNGQS